MIAQNSSVPLYGTIYTCSTITAPIYLLLLMKYNCIKKVISLGFIKNAKFAIGPKSFFPSCMYLKVYEDDAPCHLTAFEKNCSRRITNARDISNSEFKYSRLPSSGRIEY